METRLKKYFIIAGEPSGDLHGGNLIRAIKNLHPNSSFIGHGGDMMRKEGMHIIEHIDNLSIMGFTEVLKHLPRMIKIMQRTLDAIYKSRPSRIILIDYPGFNLRLAKKISYLNIPITYFILPQAWAWTAIVTVETKKLDEIGLGVDFVVLKKNVEEILTHLDYKNINEVPPFDKQNPSAENIAKWLFDELARKINGDNARLKRVEIKEFDHCGAAYFE